MAPTAALRNLRSARGAAALLRQIPGLSPAVAELPLLEAHLGRRESPLFRRGPGPARFPSGVPAVEFRRAARRWLHLMTGKATWLGLRLAEVAAAATGNPAGAVETLRVCADVSASPQLYDPFNTFAVFLEAFHRLAAQRGALAGLLDDSSGRSAFRRIALAGPGKGWWHSKRARLLVRACQPPAH